MQIYKDEIKNQIKRYVHVLFTHALNCIIKVVWDPRNDCE